MSNFDFSGIDLQHQIQLLGILVATMLTNQLYGNAHLRDQMLVMLRTLKSPDPVLADGIQRMIAAVESIKVE